MHGYTVFDNNAYKSISRTRLEKIKAAAQSHGITALAHLVVVQEMLARVRHADVERRGQNRAGLKKLVMHCATVSEGQTNLRFVTHLDGQVYRRITGQSPPGDDEQFANFRELVRVVNESERDAPFTEIAEHLEEIEQHVERKEREYIANLEGAPTAVVEPNQMKRNLDFALSLAFSALKRYGVTMPIERLMHSIIPIAQASSITFALRDSVVEEVRRKRGGHQQHANTVWDEQIVAATSIYSTIRGKTTVLVTTEARLVAAAARAEASDLVIDVEAYERRLGLDPWRPKCELDSSETT
jgi:hypothetical protein